MLPLVVLFIGLWEQERGASEVDALEAQRFQLARAVAALEARADPRNPLDMQMQFRRNGQSYIGPLALAQAREALDDAATAVAIARMRRYLPPAVTGAGGLAAGLSALVLLAGSVLGWRGRASRDALLRGFSFMRRLLPLALGAQIVLAAVALLAAAVFEAAPVLYSDHVSGGGMKLLALAAVVVLASLYVAGSAVLQLRQALAVFTPDPMAVLGRPVSPGEAPGLWRLLDDLAERLGALRPDNVAVGLTAGFFVSSGPKVLDPGGGTLSGRTLYLPLPYLPLLREDEVAAIIGHELAHFSGGDTEYSLRFVPIYMGVGRSLDAVATAGGDQGSASLLLRPALLLGVFVMDQFHHAVRHWSRLREFAADAAGAGATSPDAAARALLRTSAAHARIQETLDAAAEDPAAAPVDLVAATVRHAAARGLDDPAEHLEEQQPHPTDTHPPTRQRLVALGQAPNPALLAEAASTPPPDALSRLDRYFADPAALCQAATADFLAVLHRNAQAFREELQAMAAQVGPEEVALHENVRGGGLFLLGAGALFGLACLALLVFGVPGFGPQDERVLGGVTFVAGLCLAGYGAVMLRRGDKPFMVLRPDTLLVTGVDGPIAWEHVADFDLTQHSTRIVTRLLLPPEAPFPARVPGRGRVKLDPKRRIVSISSAAPRGMNGQAFADLLGQYRRAAEARQLLEREQAAHGLPPGGGTG